MLATTLSVLCWIALTVSISIFTFAYFINGEEGVSDNWVGYLTAYSLLGSLAITFITFLVALVLRARQIRHPLLWVSLYGFPALALTTLLLELFVIE